MVNASNSLIGCNIGNDIASDLAVGSITIEQNSVSILMPLMHMSEALTIPL